MGYGRIYLNGMKELIKDVADYIMVQNLIPTSVCKSLIRGSSLSGRKWLKHSWYEYDKHLPELSKSKKELDIIMATRAQSQELVKYLATSVKNYQQKYSIKEDHANALWINNISPIRFNRYKVGTKMQTHYDHIHSLFDGKLKGVPILSFVGLLNDNYEGGEFTIRDKEVKLTRGDILIFPSNFMYPHKVKEITKGTRYSFVTWAF